MPARPARTPRGLPGRLARLRGLPEHEVEWIALGFVHLDARPGPQVREALAGELAVGLETRDRVVDVAVATDVGVALVDQRLHHRDDLRHVLGRARFVVRRRDTERGAVVVIGADEALRQGGHRLAVLLRALDDLVVDIGDVADERYAVARRHEMAPHHVEHDQHPRVPRWQ